jgi:SWI/SNF-related matrix-associated actin-dependent regulator of chromatin subfamily A member 5
VTKEFQNTDWNVVITTYEQVLKGRSLFKKYHWEYIIVDEAHKMKNDQALISQCLRTLDSKHRLMLTGTPLQNNLKELWALLNFLVPDFFEDSGDFSQWFSSTGDDSEVQEVIKKLHRVRHIELCISDPFPRFFDHLFSDA